MPENDTNPATSDAPTPTPKHEKPPDIKHPPARRGSLTGGLALIVALIALLASGHLWYTLLYQRQELLQTDVPGSLRELRGQNSAFGEKLGSLETSLTNVKETQNSFVNALDKLQGDLSRNRADWIVAEVERLLQIANNRLQLARDVSSALSALRTADRQLTLVANPGLLPVRRELAREIALLESLEKTDVAGITLRLGTLAENINRLPLARDIHSLTVFNAEHGSPDAAGDVKPGAGNSSGIWRDLMSLVRFRNNTEVQKPLLPPEQEYFLRENLRLMLYGAQQALLQSNVSTYRQNLKSATEWLNVHFDSDTQVVLTTISELEKLQTAKIATELPDISGSLETLRKLMGRSTTQ